MISKPILFSGPMVRAILEGRKTQTRRVVKGTSEHRGPYNPAYIEQYRRDAGWKAIAPHPVGSEMWVRETWGHRGGIAQCGAPEDRYYDAWIEYKADRTEATIRRGFDDRSGLPKMVCRCKKGGPDEHGLECQKFWASWRPSIFMPRWASRLTLTVKDVRVERLQDISDRDAMAEGIEHKGEVRPLDHVSMWKNYMLGKGEPSPYWNSPRDSYHSLWDSINGPGSWDANPFVWVYTFAKAGDPDAR